MSAAMTNPSKSLLMALWVTFGTIAAYGQGNPDAEAKFVAMLKNSTLKGTWAPKIGRAHV